MSISGALSLIMIVGAIVILAARYPTCDPDHFAAFSPGLNDGWVCVRGYDPNVRRRTVTR